MAIGDRVAGQTPARQYSNQRPDPNAFGAGVSRAITNLAGATEDMFDTTLKISARLKQRNEKDEDFKTEQAYLRFIGDQNRQQAERIRNAKEDAQGITNQTEGELSAARDGFLKTVPTRLQEEYRTKLTHYEENTITSAFNFEYTAGNEKFVKDINDTLNLEASSVLLGDKSADEARENVFGLIDRSDLDEPSKRDLRDQAEVYLLKAEYQKEVEYAVEFKGSVKPKSKGDVVAAGLLPHERGILNAIGSPESNGEYNRLYSGTGEAKYFEDYSDHPRVYTTITNGPNKGQKSSAAGKYQFLASTWDKTVRKYNAAHPDSPITDFSPENQDRAALFLAREIYNRQIPAGEMTFDQVLTSGDRNLIIGMKDMLTDASGGWEGFRHMSDDAFANIILGSKGIAGGGTGSSSGPDVWEDPRYAGLSMPEKNKLANYAAASVQERDTAAARAAKARQDALTEQTMMEVITGKYTLADKMDLINSGKLPDSAAVSKWEGLINKRDKDASEIARVTAALNSGGPLQASDNNGLNLYLGKSGLDKMKSGDVEFAEQTLLPAAVRAGFIPSDFAKDLNSMMLGSDTRLREYATGVLGAAFSADPKILDRTSGLSEDVKKQVMFADSLRGLYTPEQVAQRMRDMNDPAQAQTLKTARAEARKVVQSDYSNADIVGVFDSWALGDAPYVPLSRGQTAAMRDDFETAFVEGYVLFGDKDGAASYAEKMMKRHWQPTSIGGSTRLSKFPPEVFYDTINESLDWVDTQARNDLGFNSSTQFQLIADAQTEAEGKKYRAAEDKDGLNNASYQIVYLDEQGLPQIMMREDGEPMRWAGEITPEMIEQQETAAHYAGLEAQVNAIVQKTPITGFMTPEDSAKIAQLRQEMEELAGPGNKNMKDILPDVKKDAEDKIAYWEAELEFAKTLPQNGRNRYLVPRIEERIRHYKAMRDGEE